MQLVGCLGFLDLLDFDSNQNSMCMDEYRNLIGFYRNEKFHMNHAWDYKATTLSACLHGEKDMKVERV